MNKTAPSGAAKHPMQGGVFLRTNFGVQPAGSGFALPLCLMLASILMLLGLQALRTTTLEAKLAASLTEREQLFVVTEETLRAGMLWAATNLALLPATGAAISLPAAAPNDPAMQATLALRARGADNQCPAFTGMRQHYEMEAMVTIGSRARRRHIRGFYLCTETCTQANCTGAVVGPVATYWTYAG